MTVYFRYSSYLGPTYPAYYWYFDRPNTLLCYSLREFVLVLTVYDMFFSFIGLCFNSIYWPLNSTEQLQTNLFLSTFTSIPMEIFVDHRVLLRPSWFTTLSAERLYLMGYLHIISNAFVFLFSIGMLTAVKYYKPWRGLPYFTFKAACFLCTTMRFFEWTIDHVQILNSMRIHSDSNDGAVSSPWHTSLFCMGLLGCLWKGFAAVMIFRSVQYLRDYCLHQQLTSIQTLNHDYQSSGRLVIHTLSNDPIEGKQYTV